MGGGGGGNQNTDFWVKPRKDREEGGYLRSRLPACVGRVVSA